MPIILAVTQGFWFLEFCEFLPRDGNIDMITATCGVWSSDRLPVHMITSQSHQKEVVAVPKC